MDIESIIKTYDDVMKTGIGHGEVFGTGKVVSECNRLLDLKGLTGDFNRGYRHALMDVIAYIATMRKN